MSEQNYQGETVQIESQSVRLGEKLGAGAEGSVYEIKGDDGTVAKIFFEDNRSQKEKKVSAMLDNEPEYAQSDEEAIIWPSALVRSSSGAFLGYQMPYKDISRAKNAQKYARTELSWDETSLETRLKTALNLALTVKAIHQEGHAMGDYNHHNILIDDNGFVSLIDCDAFHIAGTDRTYPDNTFFPRYAPPEGRGDNLDAVRKADRFQLGVHLFQLLMEGFHPYQAMGDNAASGDFAAMIKENPFVYENPEPGVQPHTHAPDYTTLPASLRKLFADCFDGAIGRDRNWGRPEAATWVETLADLADVELTQPSSTSESSTSDSTRDYPAWMNGETDTTTTNQGTTNTGTSSTDDRDMPDWMDDAEGQTAPAADSTQDTDDETSDDTDEREYPDWMDGE